MYYFENDPLQDIYTHLTNGKIPTHFDRVLQLKGKAQDDFSIVAEINFYKKFQTYTTHPKPQETKNPPNKNLK